jgi:UDP-glucose 4-epimerase
MKKAFVTGGAGFIGSNLSEKLVQQGYRVTVFDNLVLGRIEFIQHLIDDGTCTFIHDDLLNLDRVVSALSGHDVVFHMAANSDIGLGGRVTDHDLKNGTLATYHVLDAMRRTGISKIVFASTSAIYGEASAVEVDENQGPLFPISFYGASKLASEGLLSAFSHNYGFQVWIFRFGNIVGQNGTHGAVVDFIKKLRVNPRQLEILGNGKQAKPYLHVSDCVDGMLFGFQNLHDRLNYFHLSPPGATSVDTIAGTVIRGMKLENVEIRYTGGDRGWPGDVPQVRLSPEKFARAGWKSRYTSDEAVEVAVSELLEQIR